MITFVDDADVKCNLSNQHHISRISESGSSHKIELIPGLKLSSSTVADAEFCKKDFTQKFALPIEMNNFKFS